MLRPFALVLIFVLPVLAEAQWKEGNAASAEPRSPQEELATFTLPEGFEVELVAAEDPANGVGKFVPIAFEQRGAQFALQRLHRHRQRRLRHVQQRGGATEMQFLGHGKELAQRTKFDH